MWLMGMGGLPMGWQRRVREMEQQRKVVSMKKKHLAILTAAAMAFAAQTATAQFFTNDLTDAASVALDFNEYSGSQGNSVWSFTNDYALAQDGTTNTVLQGGAVLDWVTADDDTARSYLGTTFSNWLGKSWKAHIAIEAPASTKPYIFFGLGDPTPKESYYNEPQLGNSTYVTWRSGQSNSKIIVKRNGGTAVNTGAWQGDPGYDIYMTYNHINGTVKFEVDNWNGGRTNGVNVDTGEVLVDGYFSDTNAVHIFFGANAKVTFRDFDVHEINAETPPAAPSGVYTVISNMAVEVKWETAGGAEAYEVKRMIDGGSNYVTLASGVTDLAYVDATVETNEIYHYVVSATNQFGTSGNSAEATGKGLPYDIIGPSSSYGAGSALDMDNLFDGDIDVFADTTTAGSWAGLDLGYAQQVQQIDYVFRNWSWRSLAYGSNATFEACNDPTFPEAEIVLLGTIPANAAAYPAVNSLTVTNAASYRYVRVKGRTGNPDARPLFFLAELDFITSENIQATTNGTPYAWLDSYYDVGTLFGGDYELAAMSDTDGDGHEAWEEFIAGTDATNSASVLKVTSVEAIGGNDFVITWQSVAGKDYSIITNLNLAFPNPGVAASGIPGLAGETSVTSSLPSASSVFYEIGVQ